MLFLATAGLAVVIAPSGSAQSPALSIVPGAQGFGMQTRAAYGGSVDPTVYRVNNLGDRGAGSLRAALEASDPRVVIFEVSGTINLDADIHIRRPYVTVAGQTAPSPGITLRNYGLYVETHNVLLQHFRVRPGGDTCNSGILIWDTESHDIVLDHMSVSWGQDETIAINNVGKRPINVTVWRTIVAEGLAGAQNGNQDCSGGNTEVRNGPTFDSHGLIIYDHTKYVAVLQSLFAHNAERNPYAKGDTTSYIANNLIYDFNDGSLFLDPDGSGPGSTNATLVGNYYRRGPSTSAINYISGVRFLEHGSAIYRSDNARDDGGIPLEEFVVVNGDGIDPTVDSPPVAVPGYTPMESSAVYNFVLTNVGARPADRDAVDSRLVSEVRARTGSKIGSQNKVGGWPRLTVNNRKLTLPANPHRVTASGYTNLEVWLHSYAATVEAMFVNRLASAAPTGRPIVH
jgi:hypothetical protein